MAAFLQTTTGDLALTKNSLALTAGKTEVAQTLRSRLRVFRGEWFLDREAGTPWNQSVLGKHVDGRGAEAALKAVVLAVPDVDKLLEFDFRVNTATRTASLALKVSTTFGSVSLQEVL